MSKLTNNSVEADIQPSTKDHGNITPENAASDKQIIFILKIIMVSGLGLILLGIYFQMYNDTIEAMGVTGMVISACCVAMGMIMSLPTKMYLTFVLVNREHELLEANRKLAREAINRSAS